MSKAHNMYTTVRICITSTNCGLYYWILTTLFQQQQQPQQQASVVQASPTKPTVAQGTVQQALQVALAGGSSSHGQPPILIAPVGTSDQQLSSSKPLVTTISSALSSTKTSGGILSTETRAVLQ